MGFSKEFLEYVLLPITRAFLEFEVFDWAKEEVSFENNPLVKQRAEILSTALLRYEIIDLD